MPPGVHGQSVRARDLGIPFTGIPGSLNAITDVPGVEVGHTTLIRGHGPLVKGEGPVRTGVTAILPRGHHFDPVFAATYALNGNGEMTGIHWIEESGFLETPILITNTFSVGVVRDAVLAWMDSTGYNPDPDGGLWFALPVVAETFDVLNDIRGQHVRPEHAFDALNSALGGVVEEGNVGGGTGMIAHEFKGGIGTASRLTARGHTIGVLVQANHGGRGRFSVAGVPVGVEIPDLRPNYDVLGRGSIIVVVATDAPLLPQQLQRLVERVPIGIGRLGGLGENSSGDIFIAFSTANPGAWNQRSAAQLHMLPNQAMNPLFEATVEAVEEAILNALVAARTMTGRDGFTAHALPHERLQDALRKYGRWVDPSSIPRAVELPPAQLERLAGMYLGQGAFGEVRLAIQDENLFMERGNQRTRIVPAGDGRFLLVGSGGYELREVPGEGVRLQIILNGNVIADLQKAQNVP